MRILWIGQDTADSRAGDAVYDRRIVGELRRLGHEVEIVSPPRVGPLREIVNLARGIAYYRARFEDETFLRHLRERAVAFDGVVCSWEPLDRYAALLGRPVLPILHNVTSIALPAMYPGRPLARWLAAGAARWEARLFATPHVVGVGLLGQADLEHVRRVAPTLPTVYCPPGLPPQAPLDPDARLVREIWISGSHDWRPKRRDAIAFAREAAAYGLDVPVLAEDLPVEAATLLRAGPPPASDGTTIRFGLVADRFAAGHKLKTGHYVANNAIVLSFADIDADFRGIADHQFFIRRVYSIEDVERAMVEVANVGAKDLAERLMQFKMSVAERLSWQVSAERIAEHIGKAK